MRHRAKRRQGVGWHTAKTGLQSDVAAKRGGNAHAACTIGADGQGPQTCTHRSRCAARRAAGCSRRVPRVTADACEQRVGFAFATKLRGGGFAQEHRTGFAQTCADRCVHLPRLVGVDGFAATQSRPSLGEDQVFDGQGHTVQGQHPIATAAVCLPTRLAVVGAGHGSSFVDQAKSIQQGVEPGDALQHRLGGFHGGGLAAAVQVQQLGGSALGQVGHGNFSS